MVAWQRCVNVGEAVETHSCKKKKVNLRVLLSRLVLIVTSVWYPIFFSWRESNYITATATARLLRIESLCQGDVGFMTSSCARQVCSFVFSSAYIANASHDNKKQFKHHSVWQRGSVEEMGVSRHILCPLLWYMYKWSWVVTKSGDIDIFPTEIFFSLHILCVVGCCAVISKQAVDKEIKFRQWMVFYSSSACKQNWGSCCINCVHTNNI